MDVYSDEEGNSRVDLPTDLSKFNEQDLIQMYAEAREQVHEFTCDEACRAENRSPDYESARQWSHFSLHIMEHLLMWANRMQDELDEAVDNELQANT